MKNKILFVFVFIFMLTLPISVFAKAKTGCDYSLVSRLKQYASNVNIIYDYRIIDNEAYFDVTINNIIPEIFIFDEITGKSYYYNSTNNGELVIKDYKDISKLKYKINSNNTECNGQLLFTQYINLPIYNKYSSDPLCQGIEEYSLCHTFLQTNITYEEFVEKVTAYKNKKDKEPEDDKNKILEKTSWDKFLDFMLSYGLYIVALLAVLVAFVSRKRSKKNQFDFKL